MSTYNEFSDLQKFSVIYNLKIRDKLTEEVDSVETTVKNEYYLAEQTLKGKIPYDSDEEFLNFKHLLIEHMKEIRNQDCSKVFYEGLQMGMEFQKYIDLKQNN